MQSNSPPNGQQLPLDNNRLSMYLAPNNNNNNTEQQSQHSLLSTSIIPRSAAAPNTQQQIQAPPISNLEGSQSTLPMPNTLVPNDDRNSSRKKRTKKDRACDLCRRKKIR
ncbi:hypothetical protein BDC45DRAFT_222672 [Circinella umbellata]|nr:hypothetical protein BDC45DRAFT_222672 [Circinella umbellata]